MIAVLLVLAVIIYVLCIMPHGQKNPSGHKIDPAIEKELKTELGHGHVGDVVDVKESTDSEGHQTYTFIYKSGNSQTITIRPAKDGEESSGNNNLDDLNKDSEQGDNVDDESSEQQDSPGTVYEKYLNLSQQDKEAFYYTFKDAAAFYKWYDAAEAEYSKLHPTIYVGEGEVIDFGK